MPKTIVINSQGQVFPSSIDKAPGDVLTVTFDFSLYFAETSISSATVTGEGGIAGSVTIDGTSVSVPVSGGADGGIYDLTVTAVTSSSTKAATVRVNVEDLLDSSNQAVGADTMTTSSALGWVQFKDTQYTTGSPLVLSTDTEVDLPNNKGSVLDTYAPEGGADWLTSDKFTPDSVGDFYSFRLQLNANPSTNNRNLLISLDIGDGVTPNIIWSKTERLARGASVDTKVSIAIPLYTLSTFVNNGGQFKIECDGACDIHDIVWLIAKVIKA